MTVYLSGPMTGLKDNGKENFAKAEETIRLNLKPVHVINPWKLTKEVDEHFAKQKRKPTYDDYLRYDIQKLTQCDAVFALPGYQKSNGARIELKIASMLHIPVTDKIEVLQAYTKLKYA